MFTNVVKYNDWVEQVVKKKISKIRFLHEIVTDGEKFEVYAYETEYHYLNGSFEAASSTSFKKV